MLLSTRVELACDGFCLSGREEVDAPEVAPSNCELACDGLGRSGRDELAACRLFLVVYIVMELAYDDLGRTTSVVLGVPRPFVTSGGASSVPYIIIRLSLRMVRRLSLSHVDSS